MNQANGGIGVTYSQVQMGGLGAHRFTGPTSYNDHYGDRHRSELA